MPVIHWFRRDLRLTDNTALLAAAAASDEIIPVYILSEWRGSHAWTGPPRQEFLCGCLASLARNLESRGGRLIIRQGHADQELERLCRETSASGIFFNRDPDPYGIALEEKVEEMARELGVAVRSFKDVVLHERDEVMTATGDPYRVFTPYSKNWLAQKKPAAGKKLGRFTTPASVKSLDLPTLATWGLARTAEIIEPGEKAARKRLDTFLAERITDYAKLRNIPCAGGTSRLAQDLCLGTLSIREIYARCAELGAGNKDAQTFVSELAWREFYMQVLWHFPGVLEHEFNPKYRGLRWRTSDEDFAKWTRGETGFPIVDAGMRELAATGFMHNRLRMITAMFLTKDLRIHWKLGESLFMQRLTDGDIAANNGGWQWSAGVGADAAPYFRIQNPWLQSARWDPDGEYIKRWIPELKSIDPRQFHKPPESGQRLAKDYPSPMLDHHAARDACLEMFRADSR